MAGIGSAIGAVISLVPEIAKMANAKSDKELGEAYLSVPRPKATTPDEVFRAYQRLQMLAGQPLPGKGYMEEDLEEGVSSGVRALQETSRPSEAAAGIVGLYGNQLDQRRKLSIEEAMLRREGQHDLGNFETNVLAPYKTGNWNINQFQPYQEAQRAAAALLSSSEQNKFGALEGLSRVGVTLAGQMMNNPNKTSNDGSGNYGYQSIFGSGKTSNTGGGDLGDYGDFIDPNTIG